MTDVEVARMDACEFYSTSIHHIIFIIYSGTLCTGLKQWVRHIALKVGCHT
jgi:hypothetical protein